MVGDSDWPMLGQMATLIQVHCNQIAGMWSANLPTRPPPRWPHGWEESLDEENGINKFTTGSLKMYSQTSIHSTNTRIVPPQTSILKGIPQWVDCSNRWLV